MCFFVYYEMCVIDEDVYRVVIVSWAVYYMLEIIYYNSLAREELLA